MKIYMKDLLVTQFGLRHWNDIDSMSFHVKSGGRWNEEYLKIYAKENNLRTSPLISISIFEDEKKFIHDGLHRCVATLLAGREFLFEDEFKVSYWKYDDYTEIAPQNNWYTPFDPRTHVRTADFASFKDQARMKFGENPQMAIQWINDNSNVFKVRREFEYIDQFVKFHHLTLNKSCGGNYDSTMGKES